MSALCCCPSSISSADHAVAHPQSCLEECLWRSCRGVLPALTMQLSLDSCQKRFLRTHKKVDLAPHTVVGLVVQVRNTEKFPHALDFDSLGPLFRVSKQGPCFTAIDEDGSDKSLVQLELACKAYGVVPPDPV